MSNRREPDASPTDTPTAEVLARITDAVFALDEEWRFTYLNEQAERVLQRDEDGLLGTVIWNAFPEAVDSTFQREYERAMATQEPVNFEEFYPPLNAWFDVHAYPSETGLSVYFRDVTERVRQQHELRTRERALRRAYGVIADHDRSFPQQIDALLEIVREVVGTDYATLSRIRGEEYVFEAVDALDDATLHAGDRVPVTATICERVIETEGTLVLDDVEADAPELADRADDAAWGISRYLGAPVTVDGDVYGTFCFYDDETPTEGFSDWEVTLVELLSNWVSSELERQRQNDRLDSFASMLAHELRNPLQIAQLYHPRAADGDEAAAERVATALDRIEELLDVILVTARGADWVVDGEAVTLADAAAEAWTNVAAGDVELVVETDRTIRADPTHLQQLLENLFRNAVEHGGPDGYVRIGDVPDGFYVADDGPGIPEAKQREVFKAGYTTEDRGTGLGLTFVTQLADAYDWDCLLTESDDGGARFEFTDVEFADEE